MNIEKPAMYQQKSNMPGSNQAAANNQIVNIRQATMEDIKLIVKWTVELHHHEDDGDLKMHPNFHANIQKWLGQELDNSNSLFLIAQANEIPIGFVFATSILNDNGFLAEPMKGVVHLLWVDKNYRKQNTAGILVEEIEKCFSSLGITYIECNYTSNNQLAQFFWDKKGYQQRSITARKVLNSKL